MVHSLLGAQGLPNVVHLECENKPQENHNIVNIIEKEAWFHILIIALPKEKSYQKMAKILFLRNQRKVPGPLFCQNQ